MADHHRVHSAPEQVKGKQPPSAAYGDKLPITASPTPPRKRHSRRALLVVIALSATAGILYAVFWPKTPTFRVERLTATRFDVNTTSKTVSYAFEVQVTAENPNRRIGLSYDGGWVAASLNGTELRRGAFPELCMGHRSTVRPLITLEGVTRLDSAMAAQLAQRRRQAGFVPLKVTARVPVRIKFRGLRGELGDFSERPEVRIIKCLVVMGIIRIGGLKGIGALALWLATVALLGGIVSGLIESRFQYLIILDY